MTKYLLKRFLHGALSIICVVGIVMILVYSLMNRDLVFANDSTYTHQSNNAKYTYMYQKWEEYGYLDYVPYADYLSMLQKNGELDAETYESVAKLGNKASEDSKETAKYVKKFTEYYKSKGYTVERKDAVTKRGKVATGGTAILFAYKDESPLVRLWNYFTGIVTVDNIHYVQDDVGERGVTFYWRDPLYGGEKFSPCLIANGAKHKYLIYTDSSFPFIHQNIVSLNLGTSYTVNAGVDVTTTMTKSQGTYVSSPVIYPTGFEESSADDLHSAVYAPGSLKDNPVYQARFTDNYTSVLLNRSGRSKLGYSFLIGIIEVCLAYVVGFPLGIVMARRKDKLVDKIGTLYIVFIIAVPSLAYIFLFKAIGGKLGLPTTFSTENTRWQMYVLPIISLALPSIATLMKWMRRYMIDQMNSDYVKFARSGGLSEREIFSKHIMKNASVPMLHSVPADVLFAMTGAIITERVYSVPGAGNLLTIAINKYDNSVIVGMTLFYAVLSVVSLILGDVLMAVVDPRISFNTKAR